MQKEGGSIASTCGGVAHISTGVFGLNGWMGVRCSLYLRSTSHVTKILKNKVYKIKVKTIG